MSEKSRFTSLLTAARTLAVAALFACAAHPAPAQDTKSGPNSSAASAWTTDTKPADQNKAGEPGEAKPPFVLSNDQISLLARINAYLNSLHNVEGRFVQTDHRNEETNGRFYVSRPGKLRFDYSPPSLLRIVSDGEYLSVEDHDLKTVDKFPLDATPIQLLLGEDVNLTRDAIILDMKQDDNAAVVTLRDRSGNAAGHLQLYFRLPELELYEWVITDAQGLDTRIQLASLVEGEKKAEDFFRSSDIELEKLTNN